MEQQEFHRQESMSPAELELKYRQAYEKAMVENAALKDENARLKEQLAWFKKTVYGQKSEKTEAVLDAPEQLKLFNEAEKEADPAVLATGSTEAAAHKRKAKRTHEELAENLPVEEVLHPAEDKICKKCGSKMISIGKEQIRDELVYIPAKLYVRRHFAEVVKGVFCGKDESQDQEHADIEPCTIRKSAVPEAMLPHSFCSPELLAHIVYEKYCNAMPLYRLEKDFSAKGVNLSRTTMANWMVYAASVFGKPVWEQMKAALLGSSVIHADETVVQVLNEPGKKAKTDSRMWVYCNGKLGEHSNILFEYQPARNGDHAVRFLGDYRGYLVCDGYDGYNKLKNAVRCGCFAHVRRKFVDALPSDPELLSTSQAAKGVEYCNRIYGLERQFAEYPPEERKEKRQAELKPLLEKFFSWAESMQAAGGSKLSKAIGYLTSEKKYLVRFLESPDVPIDNNRAENAIRPFCVGRKNWLFSASVKGAQASAILYSLAATACANGLNVEEYLTRLFQTRPGTLLMPW